MNNPFLDFETDGSKLICKQCGTDISPAIRIIGKESVCRAYHTFVHMFGDADYDELIDTVAALDYAVYSTLYEFCIGDDNVSE